MFRWEPVYDFSFPIAQIPAHVKVIGHLTLSDFSEVRHLADGSNANVYIAKYNDETVVIKQIKESAVSDEVAEHEFDVEYGLLARVNHPNIIKVIGSGTVGVRKFIVLQYLGGGTMRNKFDAAADARKKSYFGGSSTFSFPEVLDYARQLASALSYLHSDVYPGAMFIHRDLKPDNIAFLEDGTLVLFDLGLTTVVRQGATADVTYQMTGNTGSLRYMAPEVVLDLPYNEKVDQYSYGVILWQMAKDAVPYDGASRASYIKYACKCAERPLVPRTWPAEFKALLHACWHADLHERPSFKDIIIALDHLIAKHPLK